MGADSEGDFHHLFEDLELHFYEADAAALMKDAPLTAKDDKSGKADAWPDDATFKHNWITRQFYGYFRRERVAMILQAIEHHYQSNSVKSDPLTSFDWSQVQIEHIMPRSWEQNWPLSAELVPAVRNRHHPEHRQPDSREPGPESDYVECALVRRRGKPGKKDHLHAHAIMHANRRLLDRFPSGWSDADIRTGQSSCSRTPGRFGRDDAAEITPPTERVAAFLGQKLRVPSLAKTNAAKMDAARERILAQMARLIAERCCRALPKMMLSEDF